MGQGIGGYDMNGIFHWGACQETGTGVKYQVQLAVLLINIMYVIVQ